MLDLSSYGATCADLTADDGNGPDALAVFLATSLTFNFTSKNDVPWTAGTYDIPGATSESGTTTIGYRDGGSLPDPSRGVLTLTQADPTLGFSGSFAFDTQRTVTSGASQSQVDAGQLSGTFDAPYCQLSQIPL